jgi:hypothetical protein
MPKIVREVHLPYDGRNYIYRVLAGSDARAILDATHELEKELGKVRGSLKKYLTPAVLKNIIVLLK